MQIKIYEPVKQSSFGSMRKRKKEKQIKSWEKSEKELDESIKEIQARQLTEYEEAQRKIFEEYGAPPF